MGIAFSALWQRAFGKEEMKVCILGLDNAGKVREWRQERYDGLQD